MRTPTVSIIMPAYNAEAFIEATITALLEQSLSDFELIVIDDGSTDRTADIVNTLAQKDARIVLLRNEHNLGLIETPNKGLAIAQGKYLARVDADDLCPANKLAVQVAYLEAHPNVVGVGTWGEKFGNSTGTLRAPCSAEDIRLRLIFDNPLMSSSMMLRCRWLKDRQLRYRHEGGYAEDYDLWARIAEAGGPIVNLPEILLFYRVHGQSITQSKYAQQQKSTMEVRYRSWAARGGDFSPAEKHFLESPLKSYVLSLSELELLKGILAKLEKMKLQAPQWKVNYELGRFFSSLLPRTQGLKDKAKLALALWAIKPKLALFYIPLYLTGRY